MIWDLQSIQDAVETTEARRAPLVRAMQRYERAWRLEFWTEAEHKAAEAEGRKLYTTPIPRNLVSLATNLISGRIRITCPPYAETKQALDDAETRGQFL